MDTRTRNRVRDWVDDLATMEGHVEQAIEQQTSLDHRSPEVAEAVDEFLDTVRRSRARLDGHRATFDDSQRPHGLAETVGDVLGAAAGMVDRARGTSTAKAVRDDIIAFTSLSVGYEMLLTSALAVGDTETSQVAEVALRDYAAVVRRATAVLPTATLDELQADADITIANPEVRSAVHSAMDRARAA